MARPASRTAETPPCLDDLRHLHRDSYRDGRLTYDLGLPDRDNPHASGDRRTVWYLGWWDAYFFERFGEPWPDQGAI